jgi:hypothetical protein
VNLRWLGRDAVSLGEAHLKTAEWAEFQSSLGMLDEDE